MTSSSLAMHEQSLALACTELLPKNMRIVRLDETGPPESLQVVEVPVPVVGPKDILIRTALAGLLYADAEARKGSYFKQTVLPCYPGREVAGTVVARGQDVQGYRLGDRVMAIVHAGGCYADYVLVPTVSDQTGQVPGADIVKLPAHVAFDQGLAYLANFRLAHLAVHALARVRHHSVVAIHGAAGGMGAMLTQILSSMHCDVTALCRGAEEVEFCLGNGATRAIDTKAHDYVDALWDVNGGKGIDFIFNGVGGSTINRDPLVVKPFVEIILYGYVAGKMPLDPFLVNKTWALKLFSASDYLGTSHFESATEAMYEWLADQPLLSAGKIYPMSEVAKAHHALDSGELLCKLCLQPDNL